MSITIQMVEEETHTFITVMEDLLHNILTSSGQRLDQFNQNLYSKSHHQVQLWIQKRCSTEQMEAVEMHT
jgi:hypothetical protein